MLCCGYTLTDFPISIRLTSLALWQSNDCLSASKATLMNMDKYFMWIHYERLHNHNKAKHNKTVCIFLGIYCTSDKKTSITQLLRVPLSFCLHFADDITMDNLRHCNTRHSGRVTGEVTSLVIFYLVKCRFYSPSNYRPVVKNIHANVFIDRALNHMVEMNHQGK